MSREQFISDIRNAVAFMAPRVESDSPFTDARYIEGMLRGTDLWLSRKTVEEFHPDEYSDVDQSTKDDLIRAVDEFRAVASDVDPRAPTRGEQREAASPAFTRIVRIVQDLARDDWVSAATTLLAEADGWAQELGWPAKRFEKKMTEAFIGQYKLDRLVFAAEGVQLVLVPVGRYVLGTSGAFDLAAMPTYDAVMVTRRGRWFVDRLPEQTGREPWSKEVFMQRCLELARLQ